MLSVHTRALVKHIESSSHEIHDIALVSGEHALVICTNSTLCKWNISNCCLLAMVEFRRSPESSTNVGHRRLLAYGPLNCIWEYQWDTANPVTHTHRLESSYIHNSQIAAWGNRFVVLPNNQAPIQIWNLLTMRHIGKVNICDEHINCVSLNDCFLATGSREHSIRVYSMHGLHPLRCITSHRAEITGVQLAFHDKVVSSSSDGTLMVHELHEGSLIWRHRLNNPVWSVGVLPCGSKIACGMDDGQVYVVSPPPYMVQYLNDCYYSSQLLHDA